jgi:hypothetical protein
VRRRRNSAPYGCRDVERRRQGPLSVCGHGGELGVAEEVAGVAVHGAAARLVAEDRQPGAIPARTWRAGRSSGHEAQLLALLRRAEKPPAEIVPDEQVELGGVDTAASEAHAQLGLTAVLRSSGFFPGATS